MFLCLQGYDYILCYCPGKGMALPDTISHFKPKPGPEIAMDIAIHHVHLSPVWKKTLQLALEMDVEMLALADIIISGWSDNMKEVPTHYIPTGNTVNYSLLKMDLCSMEKPLPFLHQKGIMSLVLCTSHTKALPKHSCLPVVVSSGLVSTMPLRKLFGNVKHAWDFSPWMLLHHSHPHLQLCVPDRYVHWAFSHWMVWITSTLLISFPRLSWYASSLQVKAILPKSSTSWRNGFVIMAHQKSYTQIMAHSMLVLPLQIGALNGISHMKPPGHTTHSPMDLLSHVSK